MRVPINLASQPFQRNRAFMVVASIASALLFVLLITLVSLALTTEDQMADSKKQIASYQAQLAKLTAEESRIQAQMRKPENAEVVEKSLFLNNLLARKGISWTRIFADLEGVMPPNVRLISVRPAVNPQNEIMLEMAAGSENAESLNDLVRRLEASSLFGSITVYNFQPPSQTERLYRYRVSATYAQRL